MLHVVISANVPQKISGANASQGVGGEEAMSDAGSGGFAALLADQIRDAVAQLDPGALEKGLKTGRIGLEADKKAGVEADKKEVTDDQGLPLNPLADLMSTASVPPVTVVAFSPLQPASQGTEAAPGEELAIQGMPAGEAKGKDVTVAMATGLPNSTVAHSSEETAHSPAEFAVGGKNLPQAIVEKAVAPQSENSKAVMGLVAGLEEWKPQVQGIGLELQGNGLELHGNGPDRLRADGIALATPVSAPVPAPVQQQAPSPALTVTPRVGSAEWAPAVSEKMVWMASQNHQMAELHLNPPNLGPVEVRLTIGQDQQAAATFVAHHPAVREAIETALPRLREMLAESGIMLGNATVSAESFGQQQQASDQGGGRSSSRGGEVQQSAVGTVLETGSVSRKSLLDGMVDIFA